MRKFYIREKSFFFFFLVATDIRRKKLAVQEGYTGKLTAKRKHQNRTQHQKRATNYKEDENNKELKPQVQSILGYMTKFTSNPNLIGHYQLKE